LGVGGLLATLAPQLFERGRSAVTQGLFDFRAGVFQKQEERRLTEEEAIASRVAQLQSQRQDFARPGLAVKGSQDFLKAIHNDGKDEKKDIKELVRIAKAQLEEERTLDKDIAAEIARQRVTVNMP
jgi:hypothetical protein